MTDDSIIDLVRKSEAQGNTPPAPFKPAGEVPPPPPQESPQGEGENLVRKTEAMSSNLPVDKNIEETLAKLLYNVRDKMAWVEVQLPSDGVVYSQGQSQVRIRPFTYDDERRLKTLSNNSREEGVVEGLLRSCVDGIGVEELTPLDRLYILFRLRGISYGDEYSLDHDCYGCTKTNSLSLKISTLEVTKLKRDDMRFKLPDSGQDVEISYPRVQDEELYSTPQVLLDNMHRFVRSVGGVTDSLIIDAFIRGTTVRDIDVLRTKIFMPDYGMEDHFFYTCNKCQTKNRVEIGLNANFFTAS